MPYCIMCFILPDLPLRDLPASSHPSGCCAACPRLGFSVYLCALCALCGESLFPAPVSPWRLPPKPLQSTQKERACDNPYRQDRVFPGIGLDTYWPQFNGIERPARRLSDLIIARGFERPGVEVVDAGLVDNPARPAPRRRSSGARRRSDLPLRLHLRAVARPCCPSSRRRACRWWCSIFSPSPQLDYETFNALGDRGVMTGDLAGALPGVLRAGDRVRVQSRGHSYHLVTGMLDDEEAWAEIGDWVDAARVARRDAPESRRACWATTTAACSTSTAT